MMTSEERIQAVANAIEDFSYQFCKACEYGGIFEVAKDMAKAAIAAADATRPKIEVTNTIMRAFEEGYQAYWRRESEFANHLMSFRSHSEYHARKQGLEAAIKVME